MKRAPSRCYAGLRTQVQIPRTHLVRCSSIRLPFCLSYKEMGDRVSVLEACGPVSPAYSVQHRKEIRSQQNERWGPTPQVVSASTCSVGCGYSHWHQTHTVTGQKTFFRGAKLRICDLFTSGLRRRVDVREMPYLWPSSTQTFVLGTLTNCELETSF